MAALISRLPAYYPNTILGGAEAGRDSAPSRKLVRGWRTIGTIVGGDCEVRGVTVEAASEERRLGDA